MKKTFIALAAVAAMLFTVAAPSTADAQGRAERQFLRALGIGAGVAAGALLFGHAARAHLEPRYHAYAPATGYYYFPNQYYAARPPVSCANGFWAYKVNRYGQPYGKPRWVCSPRGYYASHYIYR